MFRIGEFSKLTQVSIRMLRYYDENGLLKPEQIDPYTGYRLYSAAQIFRLQKIVLLRDLDFSVAEIRETLEMWSDDAVARSLARKREELCLAIQAQEERVTRIGMAIGDLEGGRLNVHYNVTLKRVPDCRILSLRRQIPDYFCEGELWRELFERIDDSSLSVPRNLGSAAIFHDEEHQESDVDVEVGLLVPAGFGMGWEMVRGCQEREAERDDRSSKVESFVHGLCCRDLEAVPTMACVMVTGPYEGIGGAYQSFALWMEEHQQFRLAGPVRQIVHRGACDGVEPRDYLTEIQVPVKKIVQAGSEQI